jgi:ribosomal protein S16
MAAAKADPFGPIRDRIQRLTIHLEKVKNQLSSGTIPSRHANKVAAYKEFLKLEIKRTSAKLEELKLTLPAAK